MFKTFSEVKDALASGKSVVDIVNAYLDVIKKGENLNIFLEVFDSSVLENAKAVDEKIANGTAGKLAGMVIGLKDNICYRGHKVTASSKILGDFESLFSATAVEKLLAEDAVIIGRLNCDEFAMGSSNENSAFGPVKNAVNPEYVPGGSSGGSASAVAANMCTISLGSDTGGSIRQPASFTGTFGYKPTYGRISRHGLIAYASSFDQIGPFGNDLQDVAMVSEIMSGADDYDNTASNKAVEDYSAAFTDKKIKVAYIKECMTAEGMDSEVVSRTQAIIENLKANGHEVEEVSFPYLEYLVPTYYVLTTAEASSNLSRFDGVHFGHRSDKAVGVEETYKLSRSEGFGPEVQRRIMAGTFVLSHGYYDAYYTKGQQVRRLIKEKTEEILKDFDVILCPTTPGPAFKLDSVSDPIQMYLQDIFTVQANLAGVPAISLPLGQHSNGMPFGIQLMGGQFKEKDLFTAAHQMMQLN